MKRLLVWLAFTAVLILMSCTPPPRGVVIGAPVVSMAYDSECAEVARGRIRYSRFDGLTTVQWTDSVAVVYLCGGHYEVWEIGRGFPVPYSTVQFHIEGGGAVMVKRYVDKNLCHYYNGDVHQYTERNINGLTEWEEYDSDHRIVNYKNSDGVSRVHQYTNGRETFFREEREGVYTYELWREYDAAGRETHRRDNRGTEWWKTYDDAGRETYYKSGGIERERAYDANGREIRRKESGKVVFEKRFDAKGRVEYYNDGKEAWTRPADKNVDDPKPFAAAEVGGR